MNGAPIIKIELEQMRQSIMHQFGKHTEEVQKAVNEELKKAVENFDYATEVQKIAHQVITETIHNSIKNYFQYSRNGQLLIDLTIKQALDNLSGESK